MTDSIEQTHDASGSIHLAAKRTKNIAFNRREALHHRSEEILCLKGDEPIRTIIVPPLSDRRPTLIL
ncbi:hypothetical protein KIN20_015955 [Parelaphostrongylus tenuis]|uniref:Uncharacterized protein n=1 Tax=Parelaphostrongylus tenuis TaxID=148309 RepID=A0AAD5QSV1_PARTN|nr:hypothetical protein KIN20_015955 [Parelaphostrongylus tenuis]